MASRAVGAVGRPPAASRVPRAADVDLPQCLILFDEDEGGMFWHHRILLYRGQDQKWLWVTPDDEIQLGDLAEHAVIPLRRAEPLPERVLGEAYVFRPLSPEDIARFLEEARALAHILNISVEGTQSPSEKWFVSDPRSEAFGEELPASALTNQDLLVRRGEVGLVRVGEVWTTCVKIPAGSSFADYRQELAAGRGRDSRLLGGFRDRSGRRFLGYGAALEKLSQEELPGFPLRGPRAAKSFMVPLRSSNQDFTAHHEFFLRKSGLAEKSAVAREHRHLHEACRLALEYDQFDLSNSAAFEYIFRRVVQVEAALKRNPRQPDFDGLESVMDSAVDEAGAADGSATGSRRRRRSSKPAGRGARRGPRMQSGAAADSPRPPAPGRNRVADPDGQLPAAARCRPRCRLWAARLHRRPLAFASAPPWRECNVLALSW